MGYAYHEKQQSHFGGFFNTSIKRLEPKKQRRKGKITEDQIRMVEIP